jgi:hypothetical protein
MSARVSYQGYILCFCAVIVAVLLHDADLMTSFEAKLEDDALAMLRRAFSSQPIFLSHELDAKFLTKKRRLHLHLFEYHVF